MFAGMRLVLSVVAVAAAASAQQTTLPIFLLAGQSNMEGHAEVATVSIGPT